MTPLKLEELLLLRYEQDTLAQVYLTSYSDAEAGLPQSWGRHFIKALTPLEDHPDVLWVLRGESENEYKVDSEGLAQFLHFLNTRPYELKKKFIFFTEAHLMNTVVANKLLKVFEELPSHFCLFLMAPSSAPLLPTVASRAIKLLLPSSLSHSPPLFTSTSFTEAMALIKSASGEEGLEKKFIEESLQRTLQKPTFKALEEDLVHLKNHTHGEAFNNALLSRLAPFFK